MKKILLLILISIAGSFKYHYGSICRREIKNRYGIRGLVEDHHIIPKEFKNHPVILKFKYNMSNPTNILMLPNEKGLRILHTGGHIKYNKYVKTKLDEIENYGELEELVKYLKYITLCDSNNIPWK